MVDADIQSESTEQSVMEGRNYQEVLPPQGHKDVGKRAFELFHEVVEYKENMGLHKTWVRNYELGRNQHWRYKSKKVSLVSANLLFIHRLRTVNHMTDNNPTFNVKGVGDIGEDGEDKLNTILHTADHWWREQEQQAVFADSCWNGETYGSAIEYVWFNPDLEYSIGEVEANSCDPFYFGLWPIWVRDVQKATAVLYYEPMHIKEAQRKWPDLASEIRTDGDILKELGDDRLELADGSSSKKSLFATVGGTVKKLMGYVRSSEADEEDRVLVVRCWVKDYSEITKEVEDPVTGEMIKVTEPKYTGHIRMVTSCNQGKLVLEDEDNPSINSELPRDEVRKCYLFDKFPFTKVNSLYETTSSWGPSDIEQLEAINIELDKALSQFNTAKDKITRSKIINPKTSGVPNEHLTNYVSILNPTNANHGITYLEPTPVQEDLLTAINIYKDFFFLIAGSFELEQADTKGKEVIAYKAIAALLERAATMMRGKIRSYSRLARERGRMYVSLMQNYYTEDRWVSYKDNGEEQIKQIRGTELLIPAKLSVVSGSTLPVSRVQEREEALALLKMAAPHERMAFLEQALEKLDWNNRKDIIEKIKAGPIGEIMKKLSLVIPQPVLQQIAQVAGADIKDLEKAAQKGELQPIQWPPKPVTMEDRLKQLEVIERTLELQEKNADIAKTQEESVAIKTKAFLDYQKALTEAMRQIVMQAGIGFDEESLKIDRFQAIEDADDRDFNRKLGVLDTFQKGQQIEKGAGSQGSYNERGMSSNNRTV